MRTDVVIFWLSVVICALSFLLFFWLVVEAIRVARRPPPAPPGGAGGAVTHTINPVDAMKQMAALAEAFAKAGPIATSAVLCAFFGAIAFASSGVLK
jgi:hypothetical protein